MKILTSVLVAMVLLPGTVLEAQALEVPYWTLTLDAETWELGQRDQDADQAVAEFIPVGESLADWSAMVTSWVAFRPVDPKELYEHVRRSLAQGCLSLESEEISETDSSLTVEWQHDGCQGFPAQHELKKIVVHEGWTFALSMVKIGGFSDEERERRLSELASAVPFLGSKGGEGMYMGLPVTEVQIKIAGGEVVSLPVTDEGPIPAETEDFKVEVAGLSLVPSSKDASAMDLQWNFVVTSKTDQEVSEILVEEVFPADPARLVLQDDFPRFQGSRWSGKSKAERLTERSMPWIFSEGANAFVFRITLMTSDGEATTLLQPTRFSAEAKKVFRRVSAPIVFLPNEP